MRLRSTPLGRKRRLTDQAGRVPLLGAKRPFTYSEFPHYLNLLSAKKRTPIFSSPDKLPISPNIKGKIHLTVYLLNQHSHQTSGIVTWTCLVLMLGSAAFADDEPPSERITAPALREQLLTRVEKDQDARRAAIGWEAKNGVRGVVDENSLSEDEKVVHAELWAEVARIDAENTQWLKDIVSERGWLTYSDVGVDGGDAAWLILQHADADPALQRRCLNLMTTLPKNEVSQTSVAMLTDRVLLAEGKNQIYGTQFVVRNGEWVPLRLEDSQNVDVRRAEVGLPPMAEYKALIEAIARGEVEIE